MQFFKTKYGSNGNLAILAMDDEGFPYGNLTVNILPLWNGQAALDTNNYPEAEETAKKLGGEPTGQTLASGFCTYPVYDFSSVLDKIKDY